MKSHKIQTSQQSPQVVYLIVRVSGLDVTSPTSASPQWRVYLDPATLEEQGSLHFRAPTYAVTPD